MLHTDIIGHPCNYARAFGVNIVEDDCQDDDTGDWSEYTSALLTFDTDHYALQAPTAYGGTSLTGKTFVIGRTYQITLDFKDTLTSGESAVITFSINGDAKNFTVTCGVSSFTRLSFVHTPSVTDNNASILIQSQQIVTGADYIYFKNFTVDDITDMVLPGTPLLTHDVTGDSQLPDGSTKDYKLSRKFSEVYQALIYNQATRFSDDSGAVVSSAQTDNIAHLTANLPVDDLAIIFMKTKANFLESADNAEVLSLGDVEAALHNSYSDRGGVLSGLIGKIPIADGIASMTDVAILQKYLTSSGVLHSSSDYPLVNQDFTLGASNPASKWLTYLSRENGVAYLMYLFKEMYYDDGKDSDDIVSMVAGVAFSSFTSGTPVKLSGFDNTQFNNKLFTWDSDVGGGTNASTAYNLYYIGSDGRCYANSNGVYAGFGLWDGNGFGDDNMFSVADGVNVMSDDNGNSVLYGTKRIKLDKFIPEAD